MSTWDVVIVGAGPAGLLAACRAAERGRHTLLVDKNRAPGAKILVSGGGRCNLTHATDRRGLGAAFGPQGRFLHSALAALGPQDLVDLLEADGVPTYVEPGGKVFPRSDRAADVLAVFTRRVERSGCTLAMGEPLQEIERKTGLFRLVTSRRELRARRVVLATGGRSYPALGTTGDGYRWAAALGHDVIPPRPALVPVTTHAPWVRALRGITIPDATVRVVEPPSEPAGKATTLAEARGAVLFAHFGLSGPAVLDVSRAISGHAQASDLRLVCDFLPDAKAGQFETELQRECKTAGRRHVAAVLSHWLPQRLAETLVEQSGLAADRRAAELSWPERKILTAAIKSLEIPVAGTMGFRKAEVTAGGVSLAQVDSRTVQSKRVPGLYFAGELLDLDGPIGGYNLQAAFSTGWLAGESV